jgi:hypothetical protein
MKKSKQRGRSDDAHTATIVEPLGRCEVDYGGSTKPEPVATPNHVPTKSAQRTDELRYLLSSETGASLNEICAAFGWQAHSARATLSGLRKSGTAFERISSALNDGRTGSMAKGPTRYPAGGSDNRQACEKQTAIGLARTGAAAGVLDDAYRLHVTVVKWSPIATACDRQTVRNCAFAVLRNSFPVRVIFLPCSVELKSLLILSKELARKLRKLHADSGHSAVNCSRTNQNSLIIPCI